MNRSQSGACLFSNWSTGLTSKYTGSKNKRASSHERSLFTRLRSYWLLIRKVHLADRIAGQRLWSLRMCWLLLFVLVQVLESQLTIWFLVIFSVPASILPIDNEMLLEGGNVTLSCNATGFPAPTVFWVKTSSGVRFNKTELVFTNINRSEGGEYTCVASNPCSTSIEVAHVHVQCKFIAIIITFF